MNKMRIKRVYEAPGNNDGYRVLVDKIWPRGVSKASAKLDEWNKTLPPSAQLRKWFGHKPERFPAFEEKYRSELAGKKEELDKLKAIANHSNLTLVYGAKDEKFNQAAVLLKVLMEK